MRDFWLFVYVATGGACGSLARFAISNFAARQLGSGFPWGTLLANLSGCFVIGILLALVESWALTPTTKAALVSGFHGSLTTFSTFSSETMAAFQRGQQGVAFSNLAINIVGGLIAVWLGMAVAERISGS